VFSIVFSTVSDLFGQWDAVFRGPIFLIKSQANDKTCPLKIDCLWLIFAQMQRRRNRIFASAYLLWRDLGLLVVCIVFVLVDNILKQIAGAAALAHNIMS